MNTTSFVINCEKIESLVVQLSSDPFNPDINFKCAVEYERLNQTASAVSFYLRTAEYGYETHQILAYTSLLKMAKCFEDQNDRVNSVSNCILQAIALIPNRPEAYFLLSQFHEKSGNWQECYTWAEIGLSKLYNNSLPVDVGFLGEYCLLFEKAVSSWWIGRKKESEELFNNLLDNYKMREDYTNGCLHNLARINQ